MVRAHAILFCGLLLVPLACGNHHSDDSTLTGPGLLPDFKEPTASVGGGVALANAGTGTAAGSLSITSRGGIALSTSAPAGAPAAPSGGAAVSDADLSADLSRAETIRIDGTVTAGGSDAVRTLTSTGGDIIIAGDLRGARAMGATQGLTLNAPAGTVYVVGSIDTSGEAAEGTGNAGGAITIAARSVVVTGRIEAAGGDASGDGAMTAGAAGAVRITAGGDVWLARVSLHGGVAKSARDAATGGAGATLTVDADGALNVTDSIDARGGPASGAGNASAGAAGGIAIGQTAPPSQVVMGTRLDLVGGAGPDVGGAGGPLVLSARGGDLRFESTVDFSGGGSHAAPGNAGTFEATVGPDAGGFVVTGQIVGNGGSAEPGGTANGGTGARLRVQITSQTGGYTFEQTGEIQLDGGASSGSGTAGGGGDMEMVCVDGNSALYGKLQALGGEAPEAGGVGGQGGILHIWTDTNHNGIGGEFVIQPSGVIDVSGGSGSIGGSGRNNGGEGVALFPVHMEQLSVLIDTETIGGNSKDGVVENLGVIISRGGAANGAGGDVMFHGRMRTGEDKTVSGHTEQQGHGTGPHGDFAGE